MAKLFLLNVGLTEIVYTPPARLKPLTTTGHRPVYLRIGTVVAIKDKSFSLQTDKLDSSAQEKLNIIVSPTTEIIEIRVPNFITPAIERELQSRGQAIKRLPVDFSHIKIGQTVSILALTDMSGLKEIAVSRVEYQKFFDPPSQ